MAEPEPLTPSLTNRPSVSASHFTQILEAACNGNDNSSEELLPLVYAELRQLAAAKLARESAGQTLQPTALVHEAWLRLTGTAQGHWKSRGHFFGAAAEAMRRILIESARRKSRLRHGGGSVRVPFDEIEVAAQLPEEKLLQVDEALSELESEAPEAAQVVKLRFFADLTQPEVAEAMGISTRQAERHWTWAKAWLMRWINRQKKN